MLANLERVGHPSLPGSASCCGTRSHTPDTANIGSKLQWLLVLHQLAPVKGTTSDN